MSPLNSGSLRADLGLHRTVLAEVKERESSESQSNFRRDYVKSVRNSISKNIPEMFVSVLSYLSCKKNVYF